MRVLCSVAEHLSSCLAQNMVPVICHNETMPEMNAFFQSYGKHPCISQLVYARVTRETKLAFGLAPVTPIHSVKALGNTGLRGSFKLMSFYGTAKTSVPLADWTLPGAFMVENGQVTSAQRYPFEGMPDFSQLVQDMVNSTENIASCASECSASLQPYVPKLTKQLLTQRVEQEDSSNTGGCMPVAIKKPSVPTDIGLEYVLTNKAALLAFKIHMTKEHSPESLLFLDQVVKYTNESGLSEKKTRAEQIIANFFDPNALLGLNINTAMRNTITSMLQEQGPVTNLFTPVVDELKFTVLSDSFARFKATPSFAKLK